MSSAAFHLTVAAAAGEPRALRDLRALLLGLTANEVLFGVKLDAPDAVPPEQLPLVTTRLAAVGDVSAMAEVAEAEAGRGELSQALRWCTAAVEHARARPEEVSASSSE